MVDKVTLAYLDRHRRRIRLVADSGAAFLLDLPRAQHLADGDGLELDGGGYVKVCAAPEAVIEIAAADRASLLRIAWHLGNRHLPLQVLEDRLRIRADHVIASMVELFRTRPSPPVTGLLAALLSESLRVRSGSRLVTMSP